MLLQERVQIGTALWDLFPLAPGERAVAGGEEGRLLTILLRTQELAEVPDDQRAVGMPLQMVPKQFDGGWHIASGLPLAGKE